ncbi:hypothetical protein GJ496_008003 [Pomphorhynchus laevis]|nr:hypothetical protein GJ496_008003 [Pomphorhynchus laevis]
MRPLCLRGHERPITKVLYNKEGDLLFSSSKDGIVSVWYSTNGERLGTYEKGKATIFDIDVTWDSKHLITASAGSICTMWDVETGTELRKFETSDVVRTCSFSYCGNIMAYATGGIMTKLSNLYVQDIREPDTRWIEKIDDFNKTIRQSHWGTLDEYIVTAHTDGTVCQWDTKLHEITREQKVHDDEITDLQTDNNMIFLITSSSDHTAKLMDIETLKVLKTYKTERPVNSASISPKQDHVLLGGGQKAHDVTTTVVSAGKFDARMYHLIYEEDFGRIKGHFGPVNSIVFHPEGIGFASGGEDGIIMAYEFDDDYLDDGDLKRYEN